ncbi:transcriptional regulator, AraC family [Photobacterium marinum]|uniref:Transcriptional regulator, AraC family n=1 Tax=Photobacterium marinum TaxID=1056511 RepID=L8JFZ8_9GAMM|nr:helix-turn-helix domain-containing protein [Photobacterium marinum]ELR67188.1 transcriptional regulator, AraC family [Photobacterium marinum]
MKSAYIELIQKSYFVNFVAEVSKRVDVLNISEVPKDALDRQHSGISQLSPKEFKNIFEQLAQKLTPQQFDSLLSEVSNTNLVPNLLKLVPANTSLFDSLNAVGDALKIYYGDSQVSLEFIGKNWWLIRQREFEDRPWFKASEIFTFIMFKEIINALVGKEVNFEYVAIQSDNELIERVRKIKGLEHTQVMCERPATGISIPSSILPQNPEHKEAWVLQGARTSSPDEFLKAFKAAIRPYISSGKLPIDFAAELTGLGVRTLQRHLKLCGTTFRQVNDSILIEYACEILLDTNWTVHQIAINLGYSDTSHFARAFRKSMNCSPKKYRLMNSKDCNARFDT